MGNCPASLNESLFDNLMINVSCWHDRSLLRSRLTLTIIYNVQKSQPLFEKFNLKQHDRPLAKPSKRIALPK
ncbi:hypothetical protein [Microcoleus sp. B13-B6]|uniref:hypothetical protein n=1 Tax=Microcoleus sp. B13-B6 TaxID=2818652 RepID=UPI002FD2BA6E